MSVNLIRRKMLWLDGIAPIAGRKSFVQIVMAPTLGTILGEIETVPNIHISPCPFESGGKLT